MKHLQNHPFYCLQHWSWDEPVLGTRQGLMWTLRAVHVPWVKADTSSLTHQVMELEQPSQPRCLQREELMSPAVHQGVPALTPLQFRHWVRSATSAWGAVIEEKERNLILLQCCDKLLFPVVISESIRMDVVEGKWRLGVVIVASGTALGTTPVVSLALPGTAVVVVVPSARDAVLVETTTGVAVVGSSENQGQQWNLVKASTPNKSQMVI